jgi:hypothetical protein
MTTTANPTATPAALQSGSGALTPALVWTVVPNARPERRSTVIDPRPPSEDGTDFGPTSSSGSDWHRWCSSPTLICLGYETAAKHQWSAAPVLSKDTYSWWSAYGSRQWLTQQIRSRQISVLDTCRDVSERYHYCNAMVLALQRQSVRLRRFRNALTQRRVGRWRLLGGDEPADRFNANLKRGVVPGCARRPDVTTAAASLRLTDGYSTQRHRSRAAAVPRQTTQNRCPPAEVMAPPTHRAGVGRHIIVTAVL